MPNIIGKRHRLSCTAPSLRRNYRRMRRDKSMALQVCNEAALRHNHSLWIKMHFLFKRTYHSLRCRNRQGLTRMVRSGRLAIIIWASLRSLKMAPITTALWSIIDVKLPCRTVSHLLTRLTYRVTLLRLYQSKVGTRTRKLRRMADSIY